MKILIKSPKSGGEPSLVVVSDPKKKKEIMRLLNISKYASVIKYLLKIEKKREVLREKQKIKEEEVDLVLTPDSVHWDLIRQ